MSSAIAFFSSSSRSTRSMNALSWSLAIAGAGCCLAAAALVAMDTPGGLGDRGHVPDRAARRQGAGAVSPHKLGPALMAVRLLQGGLLGGRRLFLVLGAPLLVGHAVDHCAAFLLGHGQALGGGRLLHPVRQAVAAEAGEIHQVDVLHVGALAQVRDEAPVDGGFEFDAGLVVHGRLPVAAPTILAQRPAGQRPATRGIAARPAARPFLEALFQAAVSAVHPAARLPSFLPAPPPGRLIALAAGKAAQEAARARAE